MIGGVQVIIQKAKTAPQQPGVYRMLDKTGKVLYVGKAKDIKKRIVAYTHLEKLPMRLQRMVFETVSMEFIVVENESKALILENELIKKLEPKYNILLKDDKTFPHIMIDMHSDFPKLSKHRGKKSEKNKYFGPFANAGAVNSVLDILQKAFLLRSCRDDVFKNRSRPCLMYQIKRCSAPCVGKISKEDYKKLVDEAVKFLDGKSAKIQEKLSVEMNEASANEDYETALVLRDRIRALSSIARGGKLEYENIKSADVMAMYRKNHMVCVAVFFIRAEQNCGNLTFFPKQTEETTDAEVMEAFLSSFYAEHMVPSEVIISEPINNADFLSEALQTKIVFAKGGKKEKLVKYAHNNAMEALAQRAAQALSMENNMLAFKEAFGLEKVPNRIEVYDNSHIQGAYAVGAMVVADKDGFNKKQYRLFNVESKGGDDLAMMKEVMSRRFAKLTDENKPDVVLIDGGRNQLNAVLSALKSFELEDIVFIAMSKGEFRNAGKETYHIEKRADFSLPFASTVAFYVQNLRDEAHRFAISSHRKKRAKSIFKSRLDEVEGVGAGRKRDLLNYFGSADEVADAGIKDLQKVSGISKKTAEKIYNYFHS